MAWLPITGWCRICWWKQTEEWYYPSTFKEARHLMFVAVRYLYRQHREAKPNCKARKLMVGSVISDPVPRARKKADTKIN